MVRKQSKKPQKRTAKQQKRDEYTVVLEGLRSDFRVFGESLSYTNDRVDDIANKVDRNTDQLDNIETRLDGVEARLDGIEVRLVKVEEDLEFVKGELAIIRHNQVTRDEFKLLETRVARLERAKK